MATRLSEIIYNGKDNVIARVILEDDGAVADLSIITRVKFSVGGVTVDSDTAPAGTIWWTDQGTYEGATVDFLKMRLGHSNIPVGNYANGCLTLFDLVNDDGAVYVDNMKVKVKATCDT